MPSKRKEKKKAPKKSKKQQKAESSSSDELEEDDISEESGAEEGDEEGEDEGDIALQDIDKQPDNSEASFSPLKKCIEDAERLFESIKGDLQRLEKMKATYENIVKGGLFDEAELGEYQSSLTFHKQRQHENIKAIVQKINAAKEVWEHKKQLMGQMWNDGVLDEGVVGKWKMSMSNYEVRIDKIDSKLQFWYGNK